MSSMSVDTLSAFSQTTYNFTDQQVFHWGILDPHNGSPINWDYLFFLFKDTSGRVLESGSVWASPSLGLHGKQPAAGVRLLHTSELRS